MSATALCTVCTTRSNDSAAVTTNLTCKPNTNYTYSTFRTQVTSWYRVNSSAVDWKEHVFTTDCDTEDKKDTYCRWRAICIFTYTGTGLECDIFEMLTDDYNGQTRVQEFRTYVQTQNRQV